MTARWSVEERTAPDPGRLAADVRHGLAQVPVTIPPKWFYDAKGSELFDAITELEEYYPTRTEESILLAHANDLPLVDTLVELGAGCSRKTRLAFNKNVIAVLARELDADLDPDDFEHVAVFDEEHQRIEMRLRARRDLAVHLRALDLTWTLTAGQEVLTETSVKFTVAGLQAELGAAGFSEATTWTDDAGDVSLILSRRG